MIQEVLCDILLESITKWNMVSIKFEWDLIYTLKLINWLEGLGNALKTLPKLCY